MYPDEQETFRARAAVNDREKTAARLSTRLWTIGMPTGFGLAATVLLLAVARRFGLGLSADSAQYMGVARNLTAGAGYLSFDGSVFASWPPLYPAVLALVKMAGVEMLSGAGFLHALCLGCVVFLAARWLAEMLESRALAVLGSLLLLLSFPLLSVFAMVWTEAIFTVLAAGLVFFAARFAATRETGWFIGAAIAAAAVCLQRYAGAAFLVSGAVIILVGAPEPSLRRRAGLAGALVCAGGLPLAGWLVRNALVTGALTGPRYVSPRPVWYNLGLALKTYANWFVLLRPGSRLVWPLTAALVVGSGLLCFVAWRGRAAGKAAVLRRALILALVVYTALLVIASSLTSFDLIDDRLLVPVYPLLIVVLVSGAERLAGILARRTGRRKVVHGILVGLAAAALVYPLVWTIQGIRYWGRVGIGVYNRPEWRRSEMLQWFRSHKPGWRAFSNDAAALYLLAGIPTQMAPRRSMSVPAEVEAGRIRLGDRFVWFSGIERPYLVSIHELVGILGLRTERTFADGAIFELYRIPWLDDTTPSPGILKIR
jgi:hypothetical protein